MVKSITVQQYATFAIIKDEMMLKGELNYNLVIEFNGNVCLASSDDNGNRMRIDIGKEIFPVSTEGKRLPSQQIPLMTDWLCIVKTI